MLGCSARTILQSHTITGSLLTVAKATIGSKTLAATEKLTGHISLLVFRHLCQNKTSPPQPLCTTSRRSKFSHSPENHYCTWKRCVVFHTLEFYPPPDVADLTLHSILVPPVGICPGRDQTHNHRSIQCLPIGLRHPAPDLTAKGGVHKNHFSGPVFIKPVVVIGVELLAFGVVRTGAGIKGEMKLRIQFIKEHLRGAVIVALACERDSHRPNSC